MKVLVCSAGPVDPGPVRALARLGARVVEFDVRFATAMGGRDGARRRLLETLERERPHVFLHRIVGDEIPPSLLDRLRSEAGLLSLGLFSDTDWRPADLFTWAAHYDRALVPSAAAAEALRQRGVGNAYHFPPAVAVPADTAPGPRRHAVALVGPPSEDTLRAVRALRVAGIAIRVWGPGWERFPDLRTMAGGVLPGTMAIETLAASRIGLIAGRDIAPVLEAAVAGALPLAAAATEPSAWLTPGREVITWARLDDLLHTARYYLTHDAEREAVARAARARVLADHTWEHRWRALFADLGARPLPGKRPLPPFGAAPAATRAPLVSVVTHVYNYARFLDELIRSVLAQTFRDFELVILDDGSTDGTAACVARYLGDPRVRYLRQENVGHTGRLDLVLQRAVDLSRGELIAFVGGDDVLAPERLERQVREFMADPSLDVLHTNARHIGPDGAPLPSDARLPEAYDRWSLLRRLLHTNLISHPTVMMRRRCLERVGPFEEATAADYRFWLKSARHLKYRYLDDQLVAYRVHPGSSSTGPEGRARTAQEARRIRRLTRARVTILDLYPEIEHCPDPQVGLATAYTDLGNIHLTGDSPLPDLALEEYRRALEHLPVPHPVVLHNAAVALALAGRREQAVDLLARLAATGWAPANRTRASLTGESHHPLALIDAREISPDLFEVVPPPGSEVWTHDGRRRDLAPATPPGGPPPAPALRIALIVHGYPPHALFGTELYTHALARELCGRGHVVHVLCPEYAPERSLGEAVTDPWEGVPVTRINLQAAPDPVRQIRNDAAAAALRQQLVRLDADLVHVQHLAGFSAAALQVCADLGLPVVMTLHDAWLLCAQNHLIRPDGRFCEEGPQSPDTCARCLARWRPDLPLAVQPEKLARVLGLRARYLRTSLALVDTLVMPTAFLEHTLAAHGFTHPRVVRSPLGLPAPTPRPYQPVDGPVRFSCIGNVMFAKGLDIAVAAFNLLPPGRARLAVFGQVHDPAYFHRVMASAAQGAVVEYRGPYAPRDLPAILAATDVAVVPSRAENYPTVVREALAAGVPVVAPAVGGVPEIIQDGVNGLLFRVGDHQDLARALRVFVDDPGRVEAFRRRIGPVPSIADDASRLEGVYREAVARRARVPAPVPGPSVEAVCPAPAAPDRPPLAPVPATASPEAPLPSPAPAREIPAAGGGTPVAGPSPAPAPAPAGGDAGAPRVSIVVRTYDNRERLERCLSALAEHTPAGLAEVIVVDDGSTDGTADLLRREEAAGHLRAVIAPEHVGRARALNLGARLARGRFLVLLHDDVVPHDGWLEALLAVMESDPGVGAAGAKLLVPGTRRIQHAGLAFRPTRTPYHIYEGWNADHPAVDRVRHYRAVSGACLALRREQFLALGGLDEGYPGGYEDVDLCLRLGKAGARVVYVPGAVLDHDAHEPAPGDPSHADDTRISTRRLIERWGHTLHADGPRHHADDGLELIMAGGGVQFVAQPGRVFTSIVMVTYNSGLDLTDCLRTLYDFGNTGEPVELVVVDNASTDRTRDVLRMLQERIPGVTVILNEDNVGFARAVNQGIRASSGRWVVLLNPDTRLTPGWLAGLRAHAGPGVGAVGPVSNAAMADQEIPRYLPGWDGQADDATAALLRERWAGRSVETKSLMFFCTLLPRAVIDEVGLLDEDFFLNQEDLEYCLRLRLAGHRLVVAPDVFVYHLGGGSKLSLAAPAQLQLQFQSLQVLYRKLEERFGKDRVPPLEELWGPGVCGAAQAPGAAR